jgi:hypothetical protein
VGGGGGASGGPWEAARRPRPPPPTPTAPVMSSPPEATATTRTAPAATATAAASGSASSSQSSSPSAPTPPRDPSALPGRTVDYPYDGADVNDPSRAYTGRAFVHDRALAATTALPLVVFLHGLNRDLIPHRWIGGGNEGDVRRIVAGLIDEGALRPVVVAGPGSVVKAAVSHGSSFPVFDLDRFVALTEEALAGVARIDPKRVVVMGHSGAGCSEKGGLVAAVRAREAPLAVVSIDTCMQGPLAEALGGARPETHVVVTWQTASWQRPFDRFRVVFGREVAAHPPAAGRLRELDPLPALPRAHDATVGQTFAKWLPRILPAGP